MTEAEIIIHEPEKLAEAFCIFLKEKVFQLLREKEIIHISLSGGNTPKKIFKLLAEEYNEDLPWEKIHFYWGDERCVAWDDPESNYGEAKRILFDNIDIPFENLHPVNGSNNPEGEAKRYGKILKENMHEENDLPLIDINILGMGDDGHTASIFPYQIDLLNADDICMVAAHPVSGQKRITITGKTLNNAGLTIFLISGENKAGIIKQIVKKEKVAEKYPTYHIKPVSGKLVYFMDNNAASLL